MADPIALKSLLARTPKAHEPSIRAAFNIGKQTARITLQNEAREAIRSLFRVADIDVENPEPTDGEKEGSE